MQVSARGRRYGAFVFSFGLCAAAVALAAAPRAAILGTWKGTSICVKSPEFPSCHDEVVVYEFRESAKGGDAVTLAASKVVNGETGLMGEFELTWDAKQEAWISEYTTPRVHILWTFFVRGDEITGTLVNLPSKHLIRNVVVVKGQKP